ncbi:MAG: 30S ribosomal protein S17 [Deltaproteobacteria bacterium]|jgi:small subunit ribosomal protein S17|nr:MAG: 30S ribosomal protein S17 [Deltaproteobacteria bacterium]TNF25017.1 MAG: 30S ribosomal protein S17 [Deltaproteobacteria bacterium]
MTTETHKSFKRRLEGIVVSDKGTQTIVVNVARRFKDKRYSKFVTKTKKYHAHDAESKAQVGDLVQIIESRPYSKLKKWELVQIKQVKAVD